MSPAGMAEHQRLTLHKSVPKAKTCIALIRTTQCMSKEIKLLFILYNGGHSGVSWKRDTESVTVQGEEPSLTKRHGKTMGMGHGSG